MGMGKVGEKMNHCKDCKFFRAPERHFYISDKKINDLITDLDEAWHHPFFDPAQKAEHIQERIEELLEREEEYLQEFLKNKPRYGWCENPYIKGELVILESDDPFIAIDVFIHQDFGCIGFESKC